jgi:hypothetical protein
VDDALGSFDNPGAPAAFRLEAGFKKLTSGETPDRFRTSGERAIDCKRSVFGACELVWCKLEPTSKPIAAPIIVSAGTLTVTRSNGERLVVRPNDLLEDSNYEGSKPDPAPLAAGERVTVDASGGDVPAFSESIEVKEPLWLTSRTIEVSAGHDAEITWSGRTTGEVLLWDLLGHLGDDRIGEVKCRFDAAAGRGIVPAALIDLVPEDRFFLYPRDEGTTKDIGGYQVTFFFAAGDLGISSSGLTEILKKR